MMTLEDPITVTVEEDDNPTWKITEARPDIARQVALATLIGDTVELGDANGFVIHFERVT